MVNQKSFFLISFLPALAYWYLEENYPLDIALAGGLLLSIIEMIIEKVFTKEIHSLSRLNFVLILLLGGMAYLFQEGILFKLQPFFTGIILGAYILFNLKRNKSLLVEMSVYQKHKLPDQVLIWLEKNLAWFLITYALFMAYVGVYLTTSKWLFFKTLGFYIAFALFMIVSIFRLRMINKRP